MMLGIPVHRSAVTPYRLEVRGEMEWTRAKMPLLLLACQMQAAPPLTIGRVLQSLPATVHQLLGTSPEVPWRLLLPEVLTLEVQFPVRRGAILSQATSDMSLTRAPHVSA